MQTDFKKLKVALNNFDLTILFEGDEIATTYHPKKTEDITNLCRIANIEEFISETHKKNYPDLFIFENKRYNLGVITNESIKKNKTICKYLGEIGSIDKAVNRTRIKKSLQKRAPDKNDSSETLDKLVNYHIKRVTDYAFEITEKPNDKDTVMAHNKRSLAAFINHNATDPNVKAYVINNTIYYKAARDINKGEQLTIDYGPDYDYHDGLYYIPSTENHLRPGKFLAENIRYYHKKPIKLTMKQQCTLGAASDLVMLPKFLYKILYTKSNTYIVNDNLSEFEKRLPVIEVMSHTMQSNPSGYSIYVPHHQQNITPLIFACAFLKTDAVLLLVKKLKVDIFVKTLQDLDVLTVALKCSHSESEFIKIAKPIIKKFSSSIDRTGVIGSDNHEKTALHILIDREWCKAITLFEDINFFDLIDTNDYDPLLASIAYGKTQACATLLKMKCVRKYLNELLLSREENRKGLTLERALKDTPTNKRNEIITLLQKASNRRPLLKKKLRTILRNNQLSFHPN